MQRPHFRQSATVDFDKVFVNGEPQYDAKEACRTGDTEAQLLVFDSDGLVKCGEVMVAQKGHFTFVCALCQMIFDSMPSFGLHVEVHMHLKSERLSEIEEIADDAFNSLMSPEPGSHSFESMEIKQEGTDESETTLNVGRDELLCDGTDSEIFDCRDCSLSFKSKMLLLLHNKKDHSGLITLRTLIETPSQLELPPTLDPQTVATASEYREQSALDSSENLICKYCDKHFEDDETLSEHIRKHKGQSRYSCPHCPRKFKTINTKLAHKATHFDLRPFACDICSKTFAHRKGVRDHIRKCHSSAQREKLTELNTQKSVQDGEEEGTESLGKYLAVEPSAVPIPGLDTCKYNNKQFNDMETLLKHIPTHEGNLKYSCPYCPKKFYDKIKQAGHIANHTENRPFKCKLCVNEYCYLSTLKRHVSKHHSKEDKRARHEEIDKASSIIMAVEKGEEQACEAPKLSATPLAEKKLYEPGEVSATSAEQYRILMREQESVVDEEFDKAIINEKKENETPHLPVESSTVLLSGAHICKYCDKQFNDAKTLLKHKLRFSCPKCPKKYRTKEIKMMHMASHSSQWPFACDLCPKRFGYPKALQGHIQRCHMSAKTRRVLELKAQISVQYRKGEDTKNSRTEMAAESSTVVMPGKLLCKYCDQEFIDMLTLSEHIQTHQGPNKFECPYCPLKFYRNQVKLNHIAAAHIEVHKNPFVCRLCSKIFRTKSTLKTHLTRSHFLMKKANNSSRENAKNAEDESMELDSLHNAKATSGSSDSGRADRHEKGEKPKSYTLAQLYAMHNILSNITTCRRCKANFDDAASCVEHIRVCPRPPKLFGSNNADEPDLKTSTEQNAEDDDGTINERTFICPFCHYGYISKLTLHSHLGKKHGDRAELQEAILQKDYTKFVIPTVNSEFVICNYCDKKFENISEFKMHLKSHKGSRKYPCSYCPKMFTTKSRQRAHTNIHTGERPFKCPHCPKGFANQTNLVKHIHAHLQIRKYECKFCGKRFVQSTTRKTHEKLHTGKKDYQCERCDSCFISSSQLSLHTKKHHLNQRNFQCDQCDKAFVLQDHLKRHMVCHTTERPFECDICHRTYPRLRALQTHQQVHSTEKKYECNICGKKFHQYAGMYMHRKSHSERLK